MIYPFTLIDLELLTNSYMLECTNTQSCVEEGENCASTILVDHLEPLFHTLGSHMNLFGSHMNLFGSDMILFGSIVKLQEPLVILVVVLINFGVKNEVTKVSFKITAGDLMSFLSHEFVDIIFCEYLDIFEIISYFRSDPFNLIDIELQGNSYMIEWRNTQSIEEGDNCASTIIVEHLDLFHTLGSDMTLFGSIFKFQEPTVMLIVVLINFGVKKQVSQVSFKIDVGDLMSVFSHEFDYILFCG